VRTVAAVQRRKPASAAAIRSEKARQIAAQRTAEMDALLQTSEAETFGCY